MRDDRATLHGGTGGPPARTAAVEAEAHEPTSHWMPAREIRRLLTSQALGDRARPWGRSFHPLTFATVPVQQGP
eukprot:8973356-Pyramimonas_sp.AAC.1